MKLIPNDADLGGIDCHVHSYFSPDSSQTPEQIVAAVREKGLKGFIVTDHVDIGHWQGCKPIDFDEYFDVWNGVRKNNPDLTIYIGLEAGFERAHADETYRLIEHLPFEYVINSVHYWSVDGFATGKQAAYTQYLDAVLASLDAPYGFGTIGHLGFLERYAPYFADERVLRYDDFKPYLDKIIDKAIKRGIRFEENTNGGGEMRLPRADFLRAYAAKGGVRPVISSDAHECSSIGRYFDRADAFLTDIFGA